MCCCCLDMLLWFKPSSESIEYSNAHIWLSISRGRVVICLLMTSILGGNQWWLRRMHSIFMTEEIETLEIYKFIPRDIPHAIPYLKCYRNEHKGCCYCDLIFISVFIVLINTQRYIQCMHAYYCCTPYCTAQSYKVPVYIYDESKLCEAIDALWIYYGQYKTRHIRKYARAIYLSYFAWCGDHSPKTACRYGPGGFASR